MSVWTAAQQRNHQDIAAVDRFFAVMSQSEVLKFCSNFNRMEYPNAPRLAAYTVVICLDTEGWDTDSRRLKEVGLNTFEADEMTALATPGPWGEEILKKTHFYFGRIEKHAHLDNRNASAGNPERNRFGRQRFLNDKAVVDFLVSAFEWPLNSSAKDGTVCPVVLLGHALGNDTEKIEKLLHWSPRTKGNLVKTIDTQIIAREVGHWTHPSNQIGLHRLVGEMGFEHRDGHTASNDAAMTTIAALQLVLDGTYKGPSQPYSLQEVVDRTEVLSQRQRWWFGHALYCFRCGSNRHMENKGSPTACEVEVTCDWCRVNKPDSAKGHRTESCVMQMFLTSNSSRPSRRHPNRGAQAGTDNSRQPSRGSRARVAYSRYATRGGRTGASRNAPRGDGTIDPVSNQVQQMTLGGGAAPASSLLPPVPRPSTRGNTGWATRGVIPSARGAPSPWMTVQPHHPGTGNTTAQSSTSTFGQPQRNQNNNRRGTWGPSRRGNDGRGNDHRGRGNDHRGRGNGRRGDTNVG